MKDKDAHLMMEALKEAGTVNRPGEAPYGDPFNLTRPSNTNPEQPAAQGGSNTAEVLAQLKADISEVFDDWPAPEGMKEVVLDMIYQAERFGSAHSPDPSGDYKENPFSKL